jgi:cytoskeletal protein CcmA (bactofilin family)
MEQSTKQMIFFLLLALVFFLIFGGLIISQARGKSNALPSAFSASDEDSKQIFQYDSATEIEAQQKINGDLVVQNADLTLAGEVYGDVLVFSGSLTLQESTVIYGHVLVIHGKIFNCEAAQIAGDVLEIDGEKTKLTKRRDLPGINKPILQFTRKSRINHGETLDGNVVILKGSVAVYGAVNGNLIVLDGTVKLKPHGLVIGHILDDGQTLVSTDGRCIGKMIELDFDKTEDSHFNNRQNIEIDDREERIRERVESKYLSTRSGDEGIFRFFGDVKIDASETIDGDVVVMKGVVELKGEVEGDVVAVFGDVVLSPSAYVDGDVVSVGGRVRREAGSTVTGDVVETTMTGVRVNQKRGTATSPSRSSRRSSRSRSERDKFRDDPLRSKLGDDDAPIFRYNRVEGLFFGLKIPRNNWWDNRDFHFALFGHLGYGFANKEARYQIGLERWFFNDLRFTLGGSLYDLTETEDEWQIPSLENSLAALLLKEDFQDFYQRKGYSFYVKQNLTNAFQISGEYRVDELENMRQETQWALFGGHKKFKPNPPIDEIQEFKNLVARVTLDTRNHTKHPSQGWLIQFEGLFAGTDLKNDGILARTGEVVDFDRYILDIRRYQPLAFGENLDFRLRAGTARGEVPLQYRFDLGGLSSLRGFEYKYFENGDRLVLANAEYNIHGRNSDFQNMWFFDNFSLILFADAGLVWNSAKINSYQEGFSDLTWADLKTNIGVAISDHDGNVRLNIAKRVDVGGEPVVVTFRINRDF